MATSVFADMALLHPKFLGRANRLYEYLVDSHQTGRTKTRFEIFETFRDPIRQRDLLKKGVTKAGPFESAHQFGLACDFVPYLVQSEANALGEQIGERVNAGWSWHSSHDWDYLTDAAKRFKLATIEWDRPHVQHPAWNEIRTFISGKLL